MAGSTLAELARAVGGELDGDGSVTVSDVVHDSRQAGPGRLFVAVVGSVVDGHSHVEAAVGAGSPAVCVSHRVESAVPQIVVADTRRAMGVLADVVHGHPSSDLAVVGVTGTNGKTTVTHNVEAIALRAGVTPGLIGTIGARMAGENLPLERTTPEATDFQRLLAEMRDRGCELVATEVSSHALTMGRVRGTRFEVAAFTNLSQDHLDFHGDMDSYLDAKRSLFTDYEVGTAVINVADPAGESVAGLTVVPVVRVGPGEDAGADNLELGPAGAVFDLVTPWGSSRVHAPVSGRFNVDNVVVASVCCLAAGISFEAVVAALADLPPVPGRFQRVSGADPVTVIVDYAHTPGGMIQVIEAARELTSGRILVVGGAGGDRDREKRPMMGQAMSAADFVFITSDNPRSESPLSIVESVAEGVVPDTPHEVVVDRRQAIGRAIAEARPGDLVLVLGRGHEPFQELAHGKVEFDDRMVAASLLAEARRSANYGPGTGSIAR